MVEVFAYDGGEVRLEPIGKRGWEVWDYSDRDGIVMVRTCKYYSDALECAQDRAETRRKAG